MNLRHLIVCLIALVLMTACGNQPSSSLETDMPINQEIVDPGDPTADLSGGTAAIQHDTVDPGDQTSTSTETTALACPSPDIIPIGQSIADEYEAVSYEQVMTWFCDGAEFEDILVALETETLTETPADELLQMLADDFTWDEIWRLIGLTD